MTWIGIYISRLLTTRWRRRNKAGNSMIVTVQGVDFLIAVFIDSSFVDLSMMESMKTAIRKSTP